MDAQLTHTEGHHYDQNALNHPGGGAVEGDHEKKSIFSRVKARAKRVKDSISKAHAGQGPDQDDEDDEHDHEEIVQDPQQVQDAPNAKNSAMGLDVNSTRDSSGPKPIPGTVQTKVGDTDSSVPAPSPAKSFALASDANSTGASAGPTPAQVTDSNQSVPAPPAPWDTSFDHDAKSGLKGTSSEKFEDTNVPKGTLGDKFGEDTDLVKHQREHVSPTSHQAKISEPVTDAKNFAMGLDVNSSRDNSTSKPIPVENVSPGTSHIEVSDSDSSVPAPSAAKSFVMASDANSTRASSSPTPTQVIDFNQNAPAPTAYDSVAPWDTSFDHDAKSGLKGTLGEKFKYTNVPKGTSGDKFGEDTDLVKHQQEHVSPTSHQAKINEHVTAHEHVSPERHSVNSGNLKSIPVGQQSREDDSLDTQKQQPREDVSPGNYQSKLTDTGANGDRDAGVSPILHSFDKMAINDDPQHQTEGHEQSSASPILGRQSIPESFDGTTDKKHPQQRDTTVADKANSAKDVIASKVDRDQNDDAYVSALEPPKEQQSTDTEMLSSPITAVASKFGNGGTDNAPPVQGFEMTEGDVSNVHSGSGDAVVSGLEPPKPQSSKLGYDGTDNNAPVQGSEMSDGEGANVQYESEMNKKDSITAQSGSGVTGSVVPSKIPSIGVGSQQKTDEDVDIGATHESTAGTATVGKTDKEKGMGEAEEKKGGHEAAKDALHKRNTDENMDREKMDVPTGKVTESKEVANRLGSSEEERTSEVSSGTGSESPGTGVVDRFKGAFTNWFGKGGETNPTVAFNDQDKQPQDPTATGEQDNMSRETERKPQANEQ